MPTRLVRDKFLSENDPKKFCTFQSMVSITDGKICPFPGGILVLSQ